MEREEIIKYWSTHSDYDVGAMEDLFITKHYDWALFVGHLVIEKLLKALYVKNKDVNVPFTHNLVRLAEEADISLDEERTLILGRISTFNIAVRYADQKFEFYKRCTKEYAEENIKTIKGIRNWLKQELTK